ncbi:TIR domain-containing protein [Turicimonas muris]|uniref:TIR domain-containing protein n=1 Tax=Turicimonas muris TaxID=1796652 RepID=UPI0023EFD4F8|nr:TIR domain-containing protein [Turicimonas muris]
MSSIKPKKHNVFISHSSKNAEEVKSLRERLKGRGHEVRNSSIEKDEYRDYKVNDETIEKDLRDGIKWAGTFILLIGKDTLKSSWVEYELEYARKQGKPVVGIYVYGLADKVELPDEIKKSIVSLIGWNSVDKLGEILDGNYSLMENPDSSPAEPFFEMKPIRC